MRNKRLWLVIVAILALIALTACDAAPSAQGDDEQTTQASQAEPAADTKEQGDEAPAASEDEEKDDQEAVAEPEEETDDEGDAPVYTLDEAGITSYRQTILTASDQGGEVTNTEILIEYSAKDQATHMLITDSTSGETYETIQIGDVTYMRSGEDDWVTMQVSGQESYGASLGILGFTDADYAWDENGCDYKGKEKVEGEQTRQYRCESSAFFEGALTAEDEQLDSLASYADIWVSAEYGVPIKTKIHWEGESDGQTFSSTIETLVTDLNGKVTIEAPEGAAAPGPDEDLPIPDNAADMTSYMGMVSFAVPESVSEITVWYEDAMADEGWEPMSETSMDMGEDMSMRSWTKDGRTANLMASASDEGTGVVLTVEAAE